MISTPYRRRLALLLIGLAAPGLAACSTSSSSSTATTGATVTTTTSGNDPDLMQVQAAADTALKARGIDTTTVTVTATTSTTNDSWMRFVVTPKPGSTATPLYGFAHQGTTWSVVAIGSSDIGCPTSTSTAYAVPKSVLASFNVTCAAAASTTMAS